MSRAKKLIERMSDILYHQTDIRNFLSIMANDEFRLTCSFTNGTEDEFRTEHQKYYYMSFCRNKSGLKNLSMVGGYSCILKVDGNKLNYRYSGHAVNYWGDSKPQHDENEDRVFNTEQMIPNAHEYILEAHINLPNSDWDSWKGWLQAASHFTEKYGIPVYCYKDESAFADLNKSRSVLVKDIDLTMFKPYLMSRVDIMYWGKSSDRDIYDRDKLALGVELLTANSWSALSPKAQDWCRYTSSKELVNSLTNAIFNARKTDAVQNIVRVAQRLNLNTGEEIAAYIRNKYPEIFRY